MKNDVHLPDDRCGISDNPVKWNENNTRKKAALLQARRFYARWWNGCGELIQALWGCTIRPLETDTNTHTAAALSMRYNPGLFIDCGAVRRRVGKAFAKLLA